MATTAGRRAGASADPANRADLRDGVAGAFGRGGRRDVSSVSSSWSKHTRSSPEPPHAGELTPRGLRGAGTGTGAGGARLPVYSGSATDSRRVSTSSGEGRPSTTSGQTGAGTARLPAWSGSVEDRGFHSGKDALAGQDKEDSGDQLMLESTRRVARAQENPTHSPLHRSHGASAGARRQSP